MGAGELDNTVASLGGVDIVVKLTFDMEEH